MSLQNDIIEKIKSEFEHAQKSGNLKLNWNHISLFLNSDQNDFKQGHSAVKNDYSAKDWELLLKKIFTKSHDNYVLFESPDREWLWVKLADTAIGLGMPAFFLASIYQADCYFKHQGSHEKTDSLQKDEQKTKLEKFYEELHESKCYSLISDMEKGPDLFLKVDFLFSDKNWSDPSEKFLNLLDEIRKKVDAFKDREKSNSSVSQENEDDIPEKIEPYSQSDSEFRIKGQTFQHPDLPEELSFISYLYPQFLNGFYKAVKDGDWRKGGLYLKKISRSGHIPEPFFLNRFLTQLLRLTCIFNISSTQEESRKADTLKKEIGPILETLWMDVYSLNKGEFNDTKPEETTFGKIHPVLFAQLIEKTLYYLEQTKEEKFTAMGCKTMTENLLRRHLAIISWI